MDWNEQYEQNMKTWMDTQQKMWDSYFETMQNMGKSETTRAWESTLKMGENMFKDLFSTQNQWLSTWVEEFSKMSGMPAQAVDSARQFKEMSTRWNKTQAELIENWFSMLKKFAPASPTDAWTEMPQKMFQTWQDSTKSIMEAQMNWMQAWMGGTGESKNE